MFNIVGLKISKPLTVDSDMHIYRCIPTDLDFK